MIQLGNITLRYGLTAVCETYTADADSTGVSALSATPCVVCGRRVVHLWRVLYVMKVVVSKAK